MEFLCLRGWVRALSFTAVLAAFGPASAVADTPDTVVETLSHERVIGTVLRQDDEAIYLKSATLGELKILRKDVGSVTTAPASAGGLVTQPATAAAPVPPAAAPAAAALPAAPSALRQLFHLPASVTASIAAGYGVKVGVVDQKSYNFALTLGWQSGANIFNSLHQYQYLKAGPLVAADDFFSDNLLQHNLSEKAFVLLGARYREDQVMAVDNELNLFAAPGRYLVKSPKVDLGVAGGLSWLYQDYASPLPGLLPDPAATRDLGVAAYQFFQFRALPRLQFTQNTLFTQSLEDHDKYIYRFLVSGSLAVTEHFSLVTLFGYGYDSRPAPGLKHGQQSLTTMLNYQF